MLHSNATLTRKLNAYLIMLGQQSISFLVKIVFTYVCLHFEAKAGLKEGFNMTQVGTATKVNPNFGLE